jgi:DNA-binding transcriptional LysR family regulator
MAAEEANISRAAARLNVSQPAVSRQIRDLEEELGLPLFVREPAGLALTEAGESALAHAREILRQAGTMVEAMHSLAQNDRKVTIKVGFLPTALPGFLAEGMRRFHRRHANACVQIFEMSPREQEEALRGGEIDLALIGEPRPEVRGEFHVRAVRKTPMAIVVPDDHRLATRKSVDLAELGDETFVSLHEKRFPDRPRLLRDLFSRAGIDPEVAIRANGLSEMLGLVGAGAGVAVAPEDLDHLPHVGVRFLQMRKPRLTLQHSAAWRKSGDASTVEAFVDELAEEAAG